MAFDLYVGNYPCNFTEKDVANLFRDFDGIKLVKVCENKSKRFAFLKCKDIDQLVFVIKKMNKKLVSGRGLVVRAKDQDLHEYVELILQDDESSSAEMALSSPSKSPFIPVQERRNKCRQPHVKSDSVKSSNTHYKSDVDDFQNSFPKSYENSGVSANKSTSSSKFMHNIYPHKQGESDSAPANDSSILSKTPSKVNNQRNSRSNNESLKNDTHSYKSFVNSYATANEYALHPKTPNKVNNQKSPRNNNESFNNSTQFCESSLNRYQLVSNQNEHEYFETYSNQSSGSLQKSCHQANKLVNDFPENTSQKSLTSSQPKHERYNHDQIKTTTDNQSGYSHNKTSPIGNQTSKNTGYFSQQRDSSSPAWVSVTNFRIGTPAEALYELFSDYNPLQVKMICNVARRDKTLCEAHICFPNKDIADDVILNFDNTMFKGRIILVNDVEDLTIMNELLYVSHS